MQNNAMAEPADVCGPRSASCSDERCQQVLDSNTLSCFSCTLIPSWAWNLFDLLALESTKHETATTKHNVQWEIIQWWCSMFSHKWKFWIFFSWLLSGTHGCEAEHNPSWSPKQMVGPQESLPNHNEAHPHCAEVMHACSCLSCPHITMTLFCTNKRNNKHDRFFDHGFVVLACTNVVMNKGLSTHFHRTHTENKRNSHHTFVSSNQWVLQGC